MLDQLKEIKKDRIPKHVAIIMDGNRRWALRNSLSIAEGHRHGSKVIEDLIVFCKGIGIEYVTVYAFSSENKSRPDDEISSLEAIVYDSLSNLEKISMDNEIRVVFLGDRSYFKEESREKMLHLEEKTENHKFVLNIAANYSARNEIVDAVKKIMLYSGNRVESIDDAMINQYINPLNIPDPDLLIRTGNERRLSNFLLWQLAYTELYFSDVMWPDFSRDHLLDAISDYASRERRYGR